MRRALILALLTFGQYAEASSSLPGRAGMFVMSSTGGGTTSATAALASVDSKIDVVLRGPIATATVTQVFRNDGDRPTEATYIFPLPPDAAVSAMSIVVGTKIIRGAIEQRAAAQKRYEDAVAHGVGAAILEQERPDIFTQTVAAIPAHATVAITLRFDTVARYRATAGKGEWELALPLVVAPRYVPGTASGRPTTGVGRAPDTDRSPDASRVTPNGAPGAGGKTDVAIEFAAAVDNVTSPSHAIAGGGKSWKLADAHTDHDVLVRWHATAPDGGWVEQEPNNGGGFAAIVVEGPAAATRKPGAPGVRATLVLDRAATTRGDADAVMHPLVRDVLEAFAPADRIAVAGSDAIAATLASDAERALETAWGKPAGPLDLSKSLAAIKGDGATVAILASDGLVADDAAAIAAAAKLGIPIHVIGFGPAPNRSLLGAIAAVSGGTVRFASTADDLRSVARDVVADATTAPQPLTVNWGTLAASDVVPANLPRLGVGQATLVVARVKAAARANARVRGDVFAIEMAPSEKAQDGALGQLALGPIARRWARDRLDELLAKRDASATLAHALKYGLVSPYTTMVAIGTDVVVEGGVKHSVAVPVSVPAGMRWQEVERQTRVKVEDAPKDAQLKDKTDETKREQHDAKKPVIANAPPQKTPPQNTHTHQAPAGAAPPPPPPPQPVTETTGTVARGGDIDKDGEGDDLDEPRAKKHDRKKDADQESPVEARNAPAPDMAPRTMADAGEGEEVMLTSETMGYRPRWHKAVGLTGGFQRFAHHTNGLLQLDGRLEYGVRTLVGLDVAFWVLLDEHYAGNALLSLTQRAIAGRWLDLGVGVGVHAIDHNSGFFGPAWALSLRIHVPTVKGIDIVIRYDGSLLRNNDGDPDRHPLTSITTGFEAKF